MIYLLIIYGLLIGSFLNVCIQRIPNDESIIYPRSYCMKCNGRLAFYDIVPVFSYIILKGRCRKCNEKIPLKYLVVEALNTSIYLILFKYYGFNVEFIFLSSIASILIIILFIDLNEMIIPDKLIILIFIFEIFHKVNLNIQGNQIHLKNSILGAIISGVIFLFIMLISRGGMGDGDIALISVLGFIIGIELILLNILLSFLLGALISLFLLKFKIKTMKDPIPFGPFIIASFFIVLLSGENIIQIYLKLFF